MMSMKPFRYAVAQVNIEATIKTLSFLDDEGCAAIRALSATAKSLVFVHALVESYDDNDHHPQFTISAVGPDLRPDSPSEGYTRDMCVPIYPNDGSPVMYRNPVHPTRTGSHQNWFPFWNCFHWLGPDMKLCVRVNPLDGGCEARRQWRLDPVGYAEMEMQYAQDCSRVAYAAALASALDFEYRRAGGYATSDSGHTLEFALRRSPDTLEDDPDESADGLTTAVATPCEEKDKYLPFPHYADDERESLATSIGHGSSEGPTYPTIRTMTSMFGTNGGCVPVVDLWFDLPAHFARDEDVPDPTDLFNLCKEISKIAMESKERQVERTRKHEEYFQWSNQDVHARHPPRVNSFKRPASKVKRLIRALFCKTEPWY